MKTRWNKELKSAFLLWICSMGFLHAQVGTWNLDLNSAYPVYPPPIQICKTKFAKK